MARPPCSDKDILKRGPWTPEEDKKLVDYIRKNGHGNWRTLPKTAGLQRCGKSCRLRWTNYLRPDIKRGRFSAEEEETIIQLHSVLGNKWSTIAARLPGRTDNEIKNYWNTHIRKRLLRMGIDPVTHSPRMDLLDLSSILNPSGRCNPSHHQLLYASLNPDLMRLAASLLCSQDRGQNSIPQDAQHTQFSDSQSHSHRCTQIPPHHSSVDQQQHQPCAAVPFAAGAEQGLTSCFDVGHYQSDFDSFGSSENSQPNAWHMPGRIISEGHDVLPCRHAEYGSSQEAVADVKPHHHHGSMFVSENSLEQGLGLGSVNLSPSSILNSTTYINSNSIDDERESDWSMKFEIQNLMYVNGFM